MKTLPVVLAIDDDPIFNRAIEIVVGRFGVQVFTHTKTESFLSMAKKLKPSLYLIDLELDEGKNQGLNLIRVLREEMGSDPVIIVISGDQTLDTVVEALDMGATDYLMKPLDRNLLATKLFCYIQTEEMRENCSHIDQIAVGQLSAELNFKVAVKEIDELGISILCKHMMPKGTSIKLKSEIFSGLDMQGKEFLFTVVDNSFDSKSKFYTLHMEFSGVSGQFLHRWRSWINTQNV